MGRAEEPNPELETVTRAVGALLRTERTVRTFPIGNELSRRALAELAPRIEPALPLELEVRRDQFVWERTPLIQERDRSELAARLYRDGVRRLHLVPGLDEAELQRFVVALSTSIHPDDLGEDYVTVLWAADLPHVRVMAVDPYLDLDVPDEVLEGQEKIPTAEIEEVGPIPEFDVPPPPEEAFRISMQDREDITRQVEEAESCPPWSSFIGAIVDLLHQAGNSERIEKLVQLLEATFHRLLKDGQIDVATELHLRIQSKLPPAADLPVRQALERMAHPERLRDFDAALDADQVSPEAAERLLILIGERVPDAVCALLCSASGERTRRIYTRVLGKIGLPVLEPALQGLRSAPPDVQPHFVRLLGTLKDSRATGALIFSVRSDDPRLRKEALRSLAGVNDKTVQASILKAAVSDPNASVRVVALRCLTPRTAQLASRRIIKRITSSEFGSFPEDEKDQLFTALATGGTEDAISFLDGYLRPTWMSSGSYASGWRRAAHALAVMDAASAKAVLEKHVSGRNRNLAEICSDALRSRRKSS